MDKIRTIETLAIESSVLCCNFINTVHAWRGVNLNEYLKTYEDFIAWCRKLEVFDEAYLTALDAEAAAHPQKSAKALVKVKEIRQLLYHFVSSLASGDNQQLQLLLPKINPLISEASLHINLSYKDNTFRVDYKKNAANLESPLWPILKSLHDLLIYSDLKRIKECPGCGWVFLDETKNAGRRWCNPADCGTRDKMLRYNQKKKNRSKAH